MKFSLNFIIIIIIIGYCRSRGGDRGDQCHAA